MASCPPPSSTPPVRPSGGPPEGGREGGGREGEGKRERLATVSYAAPLPTRGKDCLAASDAKPDVISIVLEPLIQYVMHTRPLLQKSADYRC